MNFLNPLALFGLFAASIPLILHLLNLRKLKTVEFSTLRFLKELQKTKIRKLKLKQIILLILRTLIIIFAVMAFARPTIDSSLPVISTYAKTSAVIIIDNSFSMDISDEYGNRFRQAKNTANEILKNFNEGDEACVLSLAGNYFDKNYSLTRDIGLLTGEINGMNISYIGSNLQKPLRIADKLLSESNNLNKEIYIISDAQANIFHSEEDDSLHRINSATTIYFIPIGMENQAEIKNLSIDSLRVATRIFRLDKLVEVEAHIRNNSDKDANGIVAGMYFNNDKVARRTIDIPAKTSKMITISAPAKSQGLNRAYIELEEDALDIDNKRYFGFQIPPKPSVALIGSREGSRFAALALGSGLGEAAPAIVSEFPASGISGIDFSKYDILILAGGPYRQNDFSRIARYVSKGGSVILFADEKTNENIFSQGTELLGFGKIQKSVFSEEQPAGFISVDKMHPIFEGVFKGTTGSREIVESAKIYNAFINEGGQGIIEIPGGHFFSESRLGEGKAFYFSVPADAGWSNFPVTGLYPSILYRSLFYLTARESMGASVIAGQPLMLSLPKKFASGGNFRIIDPDNTEYFKQAIMLPSGANLSFDTEIIPGNYSVYTSAQKAVGVVSINTDPAESIPELLNKEQIEKALKNKSADNTQIQILEENRRLAQSIERAKTGSELWQLFIIAALLCAFAEMLVAKSSKADMAE